MATPSVPKNGWKRQTISAVLGGIIGLMSSSIFPQYPPSNLMLWGALGVSLLSNLGDFSRAGAIITRSQRPWLNLFVGLGLPLGVILGIAWLFHILN